MSDRVTRQDLQRDLEFLRRLGLSLPVSELARFAEAITHLRAALDSLPADPVDCQTAPGPVHQSCVSYVEREDGRLLVSWNVRFGGWGMPGGACKPGETLGECQQRELFEETGCGTGACEPDPVYAGRFSPEEETEETRGRWSYVNVWRVTLANGSEPRQTEPSSPVGWLSREELLRWSPFRAFYVAMFKAVAPRKVIRIAVPASLVEGGFVDVPRP